MEEIQGKQQMGWFTNLLQSKVSDVVASEETKKAMDDFFKKVSPDIQNQIQIILKKIGEDNISIGIEQTWYKFLAEISMTMYAVSQAKDWKAITCIIIPFLMHQRISVTLCTEFTERIKDIILDEKTQQANDDDDSSFFGKIEKIFFSVVHLIVNFRLPTLKEVSNFCRISHSWSQGVNGVRNLWNVMNTIFYKLWNWMYKKITGHSYDENLDDYKNWMLEIKSTPTKVNEMKDTKEAFKYVTGLLNKATDMLPIATKLNEVPLFNLQLQMLRSQLNKIDTMSAESDMVIPPMLIYLYGESGLGKSTIIADVAAVLVKADPNIKSDLERLDILSGLDKYMYFRNAETVFFDGLSYKQFIRVYDDIFQKVDSKGKDNPELMELIRTVSAAPMLPHMASLSEKGRYHFHDRFIICTSNVSKPLPMESMSHPQALYNRIGAFKFHVTGNLENPKFERMNVDDDSISEKMSRKEFLSYLPELVEEWFKRQQKVKDDRLAGRDEIIAELKAKIKLNLEVEEQQLQERKAEQQVTKFAINYDTLRYMIERCVIDKFECTCSHLLCLKIKNHLAKVAENMVNLQQIKSVCVNILLVAEEPILHEFVNCTAPLLNTLGEGWAIKIEEEKATICNKIKKFADQSVLNKALVYGLGMSIAGSVAFATYLGMDKIKAYWKWLVNKVKSWFKRKDSKSAIKPDYVEFSRISTGSSARWVFWFKDSFRKNKKLPFVAFDVDEYLEFQPNMPMIHDVEELREYLLSKQGNFVLSESGGKVVKYLEGHGLVQERATKYDPSDVGKRERVIPLPKFMTQEACSDPNFLPIRKKFDRNTWHVVVPQGSRQSRLGNLIGLKGKVFLTFGHLIHAIKQYTNISLFSNGNNYTIKVDFIKIIPMFNDNSDLNVDELTKVMTVKEYIMFQESNRGDVRDAALMVIDDFPIDVVDITSYIIKHSDISVVLDNECQLYNVSTINRPESSTFMMHHGLDIRDNKGEHSSFVMDNFFEYTAVTTGGACGSPLFSLNPTIPRKLCGIHVAGYTECNKGMATCIYIELINQALKAIPAKQQVSCKEYVNLDFIEEFSLREGLHYMGHLPKALVKPTQTQYEKSIFYELLSSSKKSPVHLGPWMDGDVYHDPYMDGIEKYAGISPPTLKIMDITRSFLAQISARSPYKLVNYKRTLNVYESVFGVISLPFLNPINKKSSPGFGWEKHGLKGKKYYISGALDDKYDPPYIDGFLIKRIFERVDAAKQNKKLQTLYILTAKDEKKATGSIKTRLFVNPPMDYTIACRMYFGSFIAWFLQNNVNNGSLIGVNMYGTSVDYIGKRIETYRNVIAGDFKNFDGHERADVLWQVLDVINMWYGNNIEDNKVRHILFIDLVNSEHICWDFVYKLSRSVPSGHPLTSVVNTIYNMLLQIYVYFELAPDNLKSIRLYFMNVTGFYYGDDHVIGVKDTVKGFMTYGNFKQIYKYFGHDYTTSFKNEIDLEQPHDSIVDVIILKRRFIYDKKLLRYIACLDKEVIEEALNWCKKKNNDLCTLLQTVDFVVREASLWEKEYYDFVTTKIFEKLQVMNYNFVYEPYSLLRKRILTCKEVEFEEDLYLL
uniref:Nonstructural protein n=1 Tax=Griffin dicistrovirus TaxID=1888310 RepID=A0A1B2RVN0_9VIRU|nr:nonstructural protein [Griffin dicistrovirus]